MIRSNMVRNSLFGTTALALAVIMLLTTGCSLFKRKPTPLEVESGQLYSYILDYAGQQANTAFASLNGGYPVYAANGRWRENPQNGDWARGMYPGMMWLLYQSSDDPEITGPQYYKLARDWMDGLAKYSDYKSSFGAGMIFYPSYVVAYQITGNQQYRDIALEAAETVSQRMVQAGYLPAFGEPGDTVLTRRLSIESMMDIELLYWAAEATGHTEYTRRASSHAAFTAARLIGDDGRILHMADFDPATGQIQGERTASLADDNRYAPKGYSPSSIWALGQAWAIHGFTTAYRHDGNTIFLNTAQRVADFFIENLPEDGIPYWDFELPEGQRGEKDTAAASLAAASLLKLAKVTPTDSEARRYRDVAYRIIKSLNSEYFSSGEGQGILDHGIYYTPGGHGSGATSWGDYFYIEALLLLRDFKA